MVFESPLSELPTFEVVPTSQGATVFFGTGFEGRKSQLMSMTPSAAQSSESLVSSPETKPEEAPVKAKTEEAKKDEVAASPATPAPEAKVEAPPAAVTPPEPPVVEKQTQAEAASAGEKASKRQLKNLNKLPQRNKKLQQRLRREKKQHNLLRLKQLQSHKKKDLSIQEPVSPLILKMRISETSSD